MPFEDMHNSGVFDRVNGKRIHTYIFNKVCLYTYSCIGSGNIVTSSSHNRWFLGDRGVLQASYNHDDSISTWFYVDDIHILHFNGQISYFTHKNVSTKTIITAMCVIWLNVLTFYFNESFMPEISGDGKIIISLLSNSCTLIGVLFPLIFPTIRR